MPLGDARLLTRTLPEVSVVELADIGHMGPVTHGDRVNVEIEAHLAQRLRGVIVAGGLAGYDVGRALQLSLGRQLPYARDAISGLRTR